MWTDDFIESEKRRIERTPIISFSHEGKWIIVMNTDKNIEKFKRVLENTPQEKIPEDYKVYYNTPEEYERIIEGMDLRAELSEKREREHKLINPDIDKEILGIKGKQDLINYLLEQRWLLESINIDEYSEDWEVDYAQLNAEQAELKKLIAKYFKE
ncbi:hypothetical protein [Staphylococcus sp. GDY8P83P]|uniref:hypothetical protein n=1 Tax=Staphylococcus sp. GDY8P83P TaxID=2804137 RepID=UPI001AEBA86D|nr:hypothetical protein [Staphylococcus sp. GDY8P83P]